jgi:DNA-binding response OmpR family regulator
MKPYVLVVEDNPIESLRLSKILEIAGYIPIITGDGFSALDACDKYNIDAALVDIQMPHMDGFSFLDRIKRMGSKGNFPIVMMTANRHESKDIKEAISLGAKDFIVKPIDVQILTSKLDGLLKNKADWSEWTIKNSGMPAIATANLQIEILSISEMGIRLSSKMPFEKNKFIQVSWPIFIDAGIGPVNLKVVDCEADAQGFSIYLTFLGVPEHQLQKLRQLCIKLGLHQYRQEKNI